MKKEILVIVLNIMLISIGLNGCIEKSNNYINDNEENNFEEIIIGKWQRIDDNRTFEYKKDGTLIIQSMASEFQYWFDNGYLYDTSKNETEPQEYKYKINFENEDIMILEYRGYFYNNQFIDSIPEKYELKRIE